VKPLDEQARQLIAEVSAADSPPPELEAELWQRLSARLHAPLPPTAAAASQTSAAVSSVVLKVVVAVLAVGVLGAVVQRQRSTPSPEADLAPRAQVQAAPAQPPDPALLEETQLQPTTAVLSERAQQPPASALLEEAQLLGQAQRALSAGEPAHALTFIARHRARFPEGALVQEREAARVFALCATGEAAQAVAAQQAFLRTWPRSLLADRVRAACPKTPGATR
jgi:hypothetical protein